MNGQILPETMQGRNKLTRPEGFPKKCTQVTCSGPVADNRFKLLTSNKHDSARPLRLSDAKKGKRTQIRLKFSMPDNEVSRAVSYRLAK